jgi:hypothetical protein
MKSLLRRIAAFAVLAAVLEPVFFTIDRVMIFNTVPRDDYAPFLLWLVGAPGGGVPASPYGYRVLTMAAAWPLYHVMPSLSLSNLPAALTPEYVRATAALAALSYVSFLAASLFIYAFARDRLSLARREASIAGALLALLIAHSQYFGIDPFSIALVAAGLYLLTSPWAFAPFIVASVFANEKVAIVFALWLTIRRVTGSDDPRWRPSWIASLVAIGVYGAALVFVRLPGNDYQLEPGGYVATLIMNLRAMVSARGLLLNVLPVGVLTAVSVFGWRPRHAVGVFRPVDVLVIPGLMLVALVVTQYFQMGRIVMHAAPLFVIPAAVRIGRWMDGSAVRQPSALPET